MQKVQLRLRSKGKEIKVYEADIDELPIGVIKRLCVSVNIDKIIKDSKTDSDFASTLIGAVIGAYPVFEDYLLQVFPGLTQDELDKYGTPSEVGMAIGAILRYTAFKMSGVGKNLKNLIREEAANT